MTKLQAGYRLLATESTAPLISEHLPIIRKAARIILRRSPPSDIVNDAKGTVAYLMRRGDTAEIQRPALSVLMQQLSRFGIFVRFETIQNKPHLVFFLSNEQLSEPEG